jgi:hypothetical protein
MLSVQIELPFGIFLSLGSFLILFKYLYCVAYFLWAVAAARYRRTGWFLAGVIGLCLFGLVSAKLPLSRPYGLEETSEFLPSLADSMVTAARGSPFDGWRLDSSNQHPAWSLLLAALSGFNPSRLLAVAPWFGLIAILLFSGLTLFALRILEEASEYADEGSPGGRHFALFFALFLSSGQLDFLEQRHIHWPQVFLIEPHRALSLPLVLLAGGLLLSKSRSRGALGALVLGSLAYVDLTYFLLTAGAVALALVGPGHRSRVAVSLRVAGGIVLALPRLASVMRDDWTQNIETSASSGLVSWLGSSVVIPSPLPFLAVFAITGMLRLRRPSIRFVSFLVIGCLGAAAARHFGTPPVETSGVSLLMRYGESLLAGYGFHRLLHWIQSLPSGTAGEHRTRRLAPTLGLITLLPWTFFFWWQPRTMDPMFRQSLAPISPRLESLAGWVRENTEGDSVFLVWKNLGPWLPAFTGRQVLVADDSMRADFRMLLDALDRGDPSSIPGMRKLGVTHVVVLRTDLDRMPRLADLVADSRMVRPAYSVARWARVYAIVDGAGDSSDP